ncbi:hypothetical protein G5714_002585 [Onychostoma macrolepis]|uniref:Uncharacterized protein n=1 Tax=Onychostoma macrolepis TaxID=369639 RepID=A0A7J6D755_9TELE|nr:hypothetical protein G5714_023879 [Onychostoma macrolepis]KAF4115096.1 hypothetical protein G5714_002585 [Onychostoma macrolepis]
MKNCKTEKAQTTLKRLSAQPQNAKKNRRATGRKQRLREELENCKGQISGLRSRVTSFRDSWILNELRRLWTEARPQTESEKK